MSPRVRNFGSSIASIVRKCRMNCSSISRRWHTTSLAAYFFGIGPPGQDRIILTANRDGKLVERAFQTLKALIEGLL